MALTVDDTLPATPENIRAVRQSRDHLNAWLAKHDAQPAETPSEETARLYQALDNAANEIEELGAELDQWHSWAAQFKPVAHAMPSV